MGNGKEPLADRFTISHLPFPIRERIGHLAYGSEEPVYDAVAHVIRIQ